MCAADGDETGRPVVMRDIAEAAGVHVTTVSLALRNSPQLPEATRQRIQELAREMGYRPNPLVMALVQSRRMTASSHFQGTLGFITRASFRENRVLSQYYQYAAERARQLGFKVDAFNLHEYGDDARKLQRVLLARNITGLLIAPLPDPAEQLELDWRHFAAVAMTFSLRSPTLDCVEPNYHAGMRMALEECFRLGYQRPGYVSTRGIEIRQQGWWRGAFLIYGQAPGSRRKPSDFIYDDRLNSAAFAKWFHRAKPDVLMGARTVLLACLRAGRAAKIFNPREIGLLELNINRRGPHAGIYTGKDVQCPPAVDLLVAKLLRNESGVPRYPQMVLLPPVWHAGRTLPLRKA